MSDKVRNIIYGVLVTFIGITLLLAGSGVVVNWYRAAETESANANSIKSNTGNKHLIMYLPINVKYEKMSPGWKSIERFSVQNTGFKTISYSIIWKELSNGFTKPDDVRLTISSNNNGGNIYNVALPSSGTNLDIISNISIGPKVTQEYELTIEYLPSSDINNNKNRNITGIIKAVSIN